MKDYDTVEIVGFVKRETAKAVLFVDSESAEEVWIPKSIIHADDALEEGEKEITISIPDWFAIREGFA